MKKNIVIIVLSVLLALSVVYGIIATGAVSQLVNESDDSEKLTANERIYSTGTANIVLHDLGLLDNAKVESRKYKITSQREDFVSVDITYQLTDSKIVVASLYYVNGNDTEWKLVNLTDEKGNSLLG